MKRKSVPITQEVRVLRYMRIQAGLSLKTAARKIQMTDGAISHIENGKMHLPLERIEPMVTRGRCEQVRALHVGRQARTARRATGPV